MILQPAVRSQPWLSPVRGSLTVSGIGRKRSWTLDFADDSLLRGLPAAPLLAQWIMSKLISAFTAEFTLQQYRLIPNTHVHFAKSHNFILPVIFRISVKPCNHSETAKETKYAASVAKTTFMPTFVAKISHTLSFKSFFSNLKSTLELGTVQSSKELAADSKHWNQRLFYTLLRQSKTSSRNSQHGMSPWPCK